MNKLALLTLLAPLGVVAACSPAAEAEPPPLEGARIGGSLGGLTDQQGGRFDDAALAGRYRIVYFGYAFCPDVCPVSMARLSAGLRLFEQRDPEKGARVQPIFVTVDPERDNPDQLRAFASNFHPRLVALTGTAAEIDTVKRAFAVHASRVEGGDDANYLMDHSDVAYLMGPAGEPVAILSQDARPETIADELGRWVR